VKELSPVHTGDHCGRGFTRRDQVEITRSERT